MNDFFNAIWNFEFNSILGVFLYWVPFLMCFYGYVMRTYINYREDISKRAEGKYYLPTDTIGDLIGRAIFTICPMINIFASVFSVAPEVFCQFFKWIGKVFDQPLVPQKKDPIKSE